MSCVVKSQPSQKARETTVLRPSHCYTAMQNVDCSQHRYCISPEAAILLVEHTCHGVGPLYSQWVFPRLLFPSVWPMHFFILFPVLVLHVTSANTGGGPERGAASVDATNDGVDKASDRACNSFESFTERLAYRRHDGLHLVADSVAILPRSVACDARRSVSKPMVKG